MSISSIYQDLLLCKSDLDSLLFEENVPQNSQLRISNISNLRLCFDRLRNFKNGLQNIMSDIETQYASIVMYSEKSYVTSLNFGIGFRNSVENLKSNIAQSIMLLGNYVHTYEQPDSYFVLSFPSEIAMEEYIELLSKTKRALVELQKATEESAELSVDSVQQGSLLVIIFATPSLAYTVGKVMQLVIRWRKEKREQERHLKQMERYQIETDNVKQMSDLFIGAQEKIITKLCQEFLAEKDKEKPENLIAMKQCVKDFDELIDKKLRILPLPQPTKISTVYPALDVYEKPELLDEIKQIEEPLNPDLL